MIALGALVSLDKGFTAIWALFVVGYAMLPWAAMFSAVTNASPNRLDSAYINWVRWPATQIARVNTATPHWQAYGMIYAACRACLGMVPAAIGFALYENSLVPLIGVPMFLLHGVYYYYAAKIAAFETMTQDKAIFIAECFMGWLIGTYLLICASVL